MCACVGHGSVLDLVVLNLVLVVCRTAAQDAAEYPLDDISPITGVEEEEHRLASLQAELEEQLRLEQGRVAEQTTEVGAIPGQADQDYPVYLQVPRTSFTCADKRAPGYYADVETRCQAFHVCSEDGAKHSFLCPGGSVFNQRYLVCDWWYSSDCDTAEGFFSDQHFGRLQQHNFVETNHDFSQDHNHLVYTQPDIFHGAETGVPYRDGLKSKQNVSSENRSQEQTSEEQNSQNANVSTEVSGLDHAKTKSVSDSPAEEEILI